MITPEELLSYARRIFIPTAPEVQLRSAISRAYYSAYHHCLWAANKYCNRLSPEDSKKTPGTHAKLYVRMVNSSYCRDRAVFDDLRTMAEQSKKLQNLRTKADYNLSDNVVGNDVTHSFAIARQVEDQAKKL